MKLRRDDEAAIQRAGIEWLRLVLGREYVVLHVPNGGARSKVEAAILIGLGVLPGAADIFILRGGFAGVMEVKDARGKLSPAQEGFRDECRRKEISWALVRSVQDIEDGVVAWGLVERRGRTVRLVSAGGVRGVGREAGAVGRRVTESGAAVSGVPSEDRGEQSAE